MEIKHLHEVLDKLENINLEGSFSQEYELGFWDCFSTIYDLFDNMLANAEVTNDNGQADKL
jgi:hypothetical protein